MTPELNTFVSFMSLTMIFVLLFWLYRDYRIDAVRQDLFQLRDDLFDKAAAGEISYEDSAYGMIRSTINGMIRYSHKLTLPHVFAIGYATKASGSSQGGKAFGDGLRAAVEKLPKDQREVYLNAYSHMNAIMVRHIIISSPILLFFLVLPLRALNLLNRVVLAAQAKLAGQLDALDRMALSEGEEPRLVKAAT
jgi:hypothetical protein